jgi:hypothetical protein
LALGDAKIESLNAGFGTENVGRLEIAMGDALAMCGCYGGSPLDGLISSREVQRGP